MGYPSNTDANGKEVDLDRVQELFEYLTSGSLPETIRTPSPKTSANKAFGVIYFLQEHMNLIPDRFELCCRCKTIYDSYDSGHYAGKTGRHYCDDCAP